MSLEDCFISGKRILMEGALGERLKREFRLNFDEFVDMVGLIYSIQGRMALYHLWTEYIGITAHYDMPFITTTPTRRANRERVLKSSYDSKLFS